MTRAGVYWFTGLSGAGKTTLAREFHRLLKKKHPSAVLLDGDRLREVLPGPKGFDRASRLKLASSYGRLCALLAEQGVPVVCATISLFHRVQDWNRKNIPGYKEIFVRASMDTIRGRDPKRLYRGKSSGSLVGVHLKPQFPKRPHAVVDNDGSRAPRAVAAELFKKLVRS